MLMVLEILTFAYFQKTVQKKIPFLYEDNVLSERHSLTLSGCAHIDESMQLLPADLVQMKTQTEGMKWSDVKAWILSHRNSLGAQTLVVNSRLPRCVVLNKDLIVSVQHFNNIMLLNRFFIEANKSLGNGGMLYIHGITSGMRRQRILSTYPFHLGYVVYLFDYLWTRMIPKFFTTQFFYFHLTRSANRNIPRVEVLGRLCRAGFTIVGEELCDDYYSVVASKTSEPITTDHPSYGPLIRLQRVGYQGKLIDVYKFRTMYAYSEYLQAYTYQQMGLQQGGKLRNDFRVNFWGRWMRPIWLDELPMIINLFRGDLKLVGVRPLSRHYFSLYTPHTQSIRTKVKPGLIPPFYAEKKKPVTLDDIQQSEVRYTLAYLQHPIRTDLKYLFMALFNIVFRLERSK